MQNRNRAGDMLVRLYDLDFFDAAERERELKEHGIEIVRPLPYQFDRVVNFVTRFRTQWGEEVRAALYNSPATLFAAIQRGQGIVGFAAYDATAKGFFGPTGTLPEVRDKGTQRALFYACAMDMWRAGYGYLIIGGGNTGAEAGFYQKIAGAEPISNSMPGIYAHRL